MSFIDSISQAIAQMEGYYQPSTVAARNHNPGNLRVPGLPSDSKGYTIFPDDSSGWQALNNQVQLNINRGLNLLEFFGGKPGVYSGYAPAADNNNPAGYAQFVAGKTGLPIDQPIATYTGTAAPTPVPTDGSIPAVDLADDAVSSASGVPWVQIALAVGTVALFWIYKE